MCLASIVMTEATPIPKIISFKSTPPEIAVSQPPADRVVAGDPRHTARNYFSDRSGQMFAGVWESTPGRWRVTYTENEFCHITAGEVTIESEDGAHSTFRTGDSFVIPAGFSGVWCVTQPLRKLYVIFEPAAS
jgi:uncharacterized protein